MKRQWPGDELADFYRESPKGSRVESASDRCPTYRFCSVTGATPGEGCRYIVDRKPRTTASATSNNNFGATVGLGVEWAFGGNWSARAEWDAILLQNQSFTPA